jgi:toxin ParE1/3/4
MSSRKKTLKLSAAAQNDLIDILRYTGEQWGKPQLLAYRAKMHQAFHTLINYPQLGYLEDNSPSGSHQCYLIGAHVIVYRIQENTIEVIRILHKRMRITAHI